MSGSGKAVLEVTAVAPCGAGRLSLRPAAPAPARPCAYTLASLALAEPPPMDRSYSSTADLLNEASAHSTSCLPPGSSAAAR
jgi:hypothetical protein